MPFHCAWLKLSLSLSLSHHLTLSPTIPFLSFFSPCLSHSFINVYFSLSLSLQYTLSLIISLSFYLSIFPFFSDSLSLCTSLFSFTLSPSLPFIYSSISYTHSQHLSLSLSPFVSHKLSSPPLLSSLPFSSTLSQVSLSLKNFFISTSALGHCFRQVQKAATKDGFRGATTFSRMTPDRPTHSRM